VKRIATAKALLAAGCMVTTAEPGKKQTDVCAKCGNVKETAAASGQAPSCHGQKMVPR
jgi:hypothetical protein